MTWRHTQLGERLWRGIGGGQNPPKPIFSDFKFSGGRNPPKPIFPDFYILGVFRGEGFWGAPLGPPRGAAPGRGGVHFGGYLITLPSGTNSALFCPLFCPLFGPHFEVKLRTTPSEMPKNPKIGPPRKSPKIAFFSPGEISPFFAPRGGRPGAARGPPRGPQKPPFWAPLRDTPQNRQNRGKSPKIGKTAKIGVFGHFGGPDKDQRFTPHNSSTRHGALGG